MKIEYMEYFLETAKYQSISAAAKKLFMSQSTLSSIIQSIETELGATLFRRTSRGIVLTDTGERALELMQNISDQYHALHHLDSDADDQRKRNICVCIYPCLSNYLSLSLSAKLQQECYRNVILSIQDTLETKTLSRVLDGTADIAIGLCPKSELPTYQEALERTAFTLEVLFYDATYCYVNRNSKFADRTSVDARELSGERLAIAQSCLETHGFNAMNRISSQISVFNTVETVISAIATNDFIAVIPKNAYVNHQYILDGSVKCIPISGKHEGFVSFIIYNKNVCRSRVEQAIVDDIKMILRSSQDPAQHPGCGENCGRGCTNSPL